MPLEEADTPDTGIWTFPADYTERLRETLLRMQQETP